MIADKFLDDRVELVDRDAALNVGISEIDRLFGMMRSSADGPEYNAKAIVNGRGGVLQLHLHKANVEALRARVALLTAIEIAVAILGVIIVWSTLSAGHVITGLFFTFVSGMIVFNIHQAILQRREELSVYE